MLPVAVLPVAAILMGIGYWIDHEGWGGGNPVAAFFIGGGDAILGHMALLFAVGIALGMSKDKNGAAAISGLVGYLVVTYLLRPDSVAMLQNIPVEKVNAAFGNIENQFIGIVCGLIAASIYNRFSETRLPQALSFFGGRRLPPIVTALVMLFVSLILMFAWPPLYTGLVSFGTTISSFGAIGAGLYGFFNRLLIPVGLHHALNSVFWFDVAGINDIQNFWSGTGQLGITGMYQAGFFPMMMFGLPAGAFAMYQLADDDKKKITGSLMLAAAFASFFTGVTEPLEFAFMFVAPQLYLIHAILTGISLFVSAFFGWTAGFGFSAGFIDYFLSFRLPLANKPYMLLVQGLIFAVIYYFTFRWAIKVFNLSTPGRGDNINDDTLQTSEEGQRTYVPASPNIAQRTGSAKSTTDRSDFRKKAETILIGLGGAENVENMDVCATRLRVDVKDMNQVNEPKIKSAGIAGINKTSANHIQVIVGTEVEFVANEIEKMLV